MIHAALNKITSIKQKLIESIAPNCIRSVMGQSPCPKSRPIFGKAS